jgi:hypothetical protein
MQQGIRHGERIPILGELRGEIMVLEPLQVKELGAGGATIETSFPLPLISLHDLRLTLDTNAVVVKARVVHSHVGEVDTATMRYRSGVEFVEPPAYVGAAISKYLETLKGRQP